MHWEGGGIHLHEQVKSRKAYEMQVQQCAAMFCPDTHARPP